MKHILARLSLIVLLMFASHAGAVNEREWREMEKVMEYHPGKAMAQGKLALQQARAKGDKTAELNALLLISLVRANINETVSHAEEEAQGEALARELDDNFALCWYTDGRAWVKWDEGRHAEAEALWDQAATLAERHGFDAQRAWIYANRATSLLGAGRKAEAMTWYSKSYSVFEAQQDFYGMSSTLQHIGATYGGTEASAEDQAKAADYYRRALDLIDPQVYRRIAVILYLRLGLSQHRLNKLAEARQLLEKAVAISRGLDFPILEATSELHLANLYRDERRFAEALARADRAWEIFREHPNKEMMVRAVVTRTELLAALGRKKESLESLAEAKSLLAEMNTPPVAVYFYTGVANAYFWLGDYVEAYRQVQAAREADRRMAEAINSQIGDELRVRFEVQLKDSENVLLRSQKKEAESRRLALTLALVLSVLLLGGVAFYLRRRAAAARTQAAHQQALADAETKRAQTLQAANSTLERLATVGHQITATLQDDKVIDALYRNAGSLLGVSSLSIWLLDEDNIRLRFGICDDQPLPATSVPLDVPTSSLARCVREQHELLLAFPPDEGDAPDNSSVTRTALFAPLLVGGEALGVLLLESAKPNAYGERERQIVRTLTAYGAVALSNAAKTQSLIAASQAKSAFLANMSHELRSPLNAVLGFTNLMLRDPELRSETRDDLGVILSSGEHLYTLINQILDLSKIEAGRTTLNEVDFDMYALLDELESMFSLTAKQKGLQLVIDYDPVLPKHVHADAVKLRQVLINLINNALKFTSEGGVTLQVGVRSIEPACVLAFAVTDTGAGIAAEELDKLGGAFVQAAAGQQAQEGTGLGLAISSSFVRLMQGELKLRSQFGQGTTIFFDIPVQLAEAAAVAAVHDKRRVLALSPVQPAYRILVADDRTESRQLLTRLLSPLGFEVREAANGEEAIRIWEEWGPHLIWMDLRMPVMDGREAARRIKATGKGKDTIIIALTASSFEEEREQILVDGCDDFLRKPFREEVLLDLMHKHLGAHFIYDDEPAAAAILAPDAAALEALPADLLAELDLGLTELDVDAVERVIETIRGIDAVLGEALAQMAYRYEYSRMRELVARKLTA
jgi:signal transduction histidine kinase/CheY-like chemotaxis protein/tetratricopeptide (TPR) repeat protein